MGRQPWFTVRRSDLRLDTFRAGGKGGQNQNKRDTGVRITHLATGISAESREHRTQHQNRKAALHKLAQRLVQHRLAQERTKKPDRTTRVIRTCNIAENRIVDHDTGQKCAYHGTKMVDVMDARAREVLMRDTHHEGR